MHVIGRIVLTDGTHLAMVPCMRTLMPVETSERPIPADASADPWLVWSVQGATEREQLSVAELAECRCPDLCDRDHANE